MRLNGMRKKLIAVLLIMAILFPMLETVPAFAKDGVEGSVVAQTGIYMRKGPGTDYANIMLGDEKVLLTNGLPVTIMGEVNGWYHIKVTVDGKALEGYSKAGDNGVTWIAPQATPLKESYLKGHVTASSGLNVRKGPATTFDKAIDGTLSFGFPVIITSQENGWYGVILEYNGKTVYAYCSAEYIAVDEGEVIAEDKPEPTKAPKAEEKPEPTKTPEPAENPEEDKEPEVFDPFDLSKDIPDGYVLGSLNFNSKFNCLGNVTTGQESGKLNVREFRSTYADVLTVLNEGQKVNVINAFLVSYEDENGKNVSERWFEVIAVVDGVCYDGFVLGKYITLDYTNPVPVTLKYSDQVLKKKAAVSSDTIKGSDKKDLKLAARTEAVIIGEKLNSSDNKWYKLRVVVDGEKYEGYIRDNRVLFAETLTTFVLPYYKVREKNSKTGSSPSNEDKTFTFTKANAFVKDAPGLPVHTSSGWATPAVYDSNNLPVFLYTGDSIEVLEASIVDGVVWCLVRFYFRGNEYTGYITSDHVESGPSLNLLSNDEVNAYNALPFEERLITQGFPQSYITKLMALHEQYPLWEFKALKTGLDWEDVIKNENIVGENLIENDYVGVEWKSFEKGAYSWKTDTFVPFDGSIWVTVSEAGLRYFMDPRNFLEPDTIFQYEVLNFNPSYQDIAGIEKIIRNTALNDSSYTYIDDYGESRTITYAQSILMAAEYSGVSPFHLASRIKQEITRGVNSVSNSVTGTVEGYEGLYNYYNIGANNSTVPGGAIKNGLRFASKGSSSESLNMSCLIPWTSKFRSILGGAFYIGKNYINKGQNTIYLQKFNVTGTNTYQHQYMANVEAPYSEGKRVLNAYDEPENIAIVFSIPVYENMPENPSPRPAKQYNPNNWLKSLKITDTDGDTLSLTPSFDPSSETEYSLIIGADVDELKIKASAVSSLAKVISDSTIYPKVGLNVYDVNVQAENGDVRAYRLNIVREEPVVVEPEPVIVEPEPVIEPEPVAEPESVDNVTPSENGSEASQSGQESGSSQGKVFISGSEDAEEGTGAVNEPASESTNVVNPPEGILYDE